MQAIVEYPGEFPSGQRGQTVNLLRFASMVRIRPPPPQKIQHQKVLDFLCCWMRDSKNIIATCRWHVAATSANTGGYLTIYPVGISATNPSSPIVSSTNVTDHGFFIAEEYTGFERRLIASVRWTVAGNLASPQRRESVLSAPLFAIFSVREGARIRVTNPPKTISPSTLEPCASLLHQKSCFQKEKA